MIHPAKAAIGLADRLSGYILLQVQRNGETWYVYPKDKQRYYLGNPIDAFHVMKVLSLGISNADLAKIPVAGSASTGDPALRQRLSGYFLLQVEDRGRVWYVYPKNQQRYYLGSPTTAFYIMGHLSVGITNADLSAIPVASGFDAPTPTIAGLKYTTPTVATSRGSFVVDTLAVDQAEHRIMTDTAQTVDCRNGCTVYPLVTYVTRRKAVAGIHGTYFCPTDYASCAGQTNSYLYPVFNSFSRMMINNGRIKYTTQPLVAIDDQNRPSYYHRAIDFRGQGTFESTAGRPLQAAISNGPAMVEQGRNVLNTAILDAKQATVKSYRGAFGWKGSTYYLMVVRGATIIDSAAVMEALGLDYAINLDGGGSTALYTNGHYVIGPGRHLPNAIVVTP